MNVYMKSFFVSILIGCISGAIDIAPMLLKKMDKYSILSAFVQYVIVSAVIFHINIPGCPWFLKGSLVAFVFALPIMILVSGKEPGAIIPIAVMSVVLGFLISVAARFFV
jgi:hypothetical protein